MKKLLTIIFLIAIGAMTYYGYPIVKNRYFSNSVSEKISVVDISDETVGETEPPANIEAGPNAGNETSPEPLGLEDSLSDGSANSSNTPADSKILNLNERGTPSDENLAHITTKHCNNDCNAFSMDFKLLEYCQQVCGIAPVKAVSDCDGKSGIEKDYCQKDLAITKKDSKLCDNIKDANIKLTCQNRIIEDLLENQQASPALTPGY